MKLLITFLLVGLVVVNALPKRGGGRGGGRPCGGKDNIKSCTCEDGEEYTTKEDLKENCKRKENPIQSCTCVEGDAWTPKERPGKEDRQGTKGRSRRPCGGKDNIVSCTCEDEEEYNTKEDLKENCKRKENPIQSCACSDQTTWTPPEKPEKPNRPGRPCGGKDNIESCTCADKKTYGVDELKENCKRRGENANPIESCTCVDETTWTPEDKPERPGKPCGKLSNVADCTCEDNQTYDNKRDLRKNCKKRGSNKNPIKSCNCKDDTTWPAPTEE